MLTGGNSKALVPLLVVQNSFFNEVWHRPGLVRVRPSAMELFSAESRDVTYLYSYYLKSFCDPNLLTVNAKILIG